jgi:hypothetical protein
MSAAIRPIPERETYVPEFTPRFPDETLPVRGRNGKPLGFAISDVLEERRFALAADGQCLNERDFEPTYVKWITRVCIPDGRVINLASINKYYDPRLEPVPNPEEFVNARWLNGRVVNITFDETKVEMLRSPAPTDRKYDASGEIVSAERARASLADRSAIAKIEALRDLLSDGTITEAIFTAKVTALVGGSVPAAEVVAAAELPPGFDSVLVDAEPPRAEKPAKAMKVAPCGKEMAAGVAMHIRHCKDEACIAAHALKE